MTKRTFNRPIATTLIGVGVLFALGVFVLGPISSPTGQVMGDSTPPMGIMGLLQQTLSRFGGFRGYPSASGATELRPEGNFIPSTATGSSNLAAFQKSRLDQAVKEGKITGDQENQILSQLAAIRAKQQELLSLQQAFANWLKANNISTAILGGEPLRKPPALRPSGYPTPGPTNLQP